MSRALGVDLGDARTGLALGDELTRIASPLRVIECPIGREDGGALLREIARAVEGELGPRDIVVLGLPLNMDGSEGPRAGLVRAWGERIARATGRRVELVDERLSSAAADERMARTGLTRGQKKARRDALAAAAILDSYFQTRDIRGRAGNGSGGDEPGGEDPDGQGRTR